jgi:spore germination protein YaaH
MKNIFITCIFIGLICDTSIIFSQPAGSKDFQSQLQISKSIHQHEWEHYQTIAPERQPPEFVGRPMNLIPRDAAPTREVFGYLPYWAYSSYPFLNYNLLTTIAYFGVDINEDGNITNLHDWPAAGLINQAHSQGVRVVLTVILFNSSQIATLLNDPSHRSNLISNLLTEVQNANADGVTIDFEGVPASQRQNLTSFMIDLTIAFHNNIPGSFVTIFTPAVDWSIAFDYLNLSQVTDGLIMQGYDYHWSTAPTAGPVAPLTGGSTWGTYCVSWTVDDYLSETMQNVSKLILSVPFYGFEWETISSNLGAATQGAGTTLFYSTAYTNALQYGRLWDQESQTPYYMYNYTGQWNQGWYDDSLSLALKFNLVNGDNLKGAAIWALSYDGQRQELQAAIANAFGSTITPLKPTNLSITNLGNGSVLVSVSPAAGATSYRLYKSTDGVNFNQGTDYPNPETILNSVSTDSSYFFKVSAVNGNGESPLTEVLAVKPAFIVPDVLIVNGFDRISGTVNTFDFIKRFAPALVKTDRAFDSCSNECIIDGNLSLQDYEIVIWISGEEGTTDESFSTIEQQRVAEFLEAGGKLFISGSEIGYDLVERGTPADQTFYQLFFKAQYVLDAVNTYVISGVSPGIFVNLLNLNFDNGTHGAYNVDYPDGIKPVYGSVQCMTYNGFSPSTYGGSGIAYEGNFGAGTTPGKLVYLAVPFEALYPEAVRDSVMARIIQFFDVPTGLDWSNNLVLPDKFELGQNFPNPFNYSTTINFTIIGSTAQETRLVIYDILGQEIVTLLDETRSAGRYEVVWNGKDQYGQLVPSGIYLYRLWVADQSITRKMSLLK